MLKIGGSEAPTGRPAYRAQPIDRDAMSHLGRMVDDMMRSGMSLWLIGQMAGCRAAVVSRIRLNSNYDPRYSTARKLINLHAKLANKDTNEQ